MKKACLTGTFDPPTLGHIDLINRSLALPFTLLIGIGENSLKKPLIPLPERISLIQKLYPSIQVLPIASLTSDFLKQNQIEILIRGIRSEADFTYEADMASLNQPFETLFLSSRYPHLRSSLIREIICGKGNLEPLLPPLVIDFFNNVKS